MTEAKHKTVAVVILAAFVLGATRCVTLLGWPTGMLLGGCLAFSVFLVIDAFSSLKRLACFRRGVATCFALFMLAVILAATWISPDFQYSIDRIAAERAMRRELTSVFDSDERFELLTSSISTRKATYVELRGSLPNTGALEDARDAIREQCPSVSAGALVSWSVKISDTGQRIELNDGRLDQWDEKRNAE